jgi:hypothetical protein
MAYLPGSYWPTGAFPAGYWPGLVAGATSGDPPSDAEVYASILALLRGTSRFGEVKLAQESQVDDLVAREGHRLLLVPDERVRTTRETTPGRFLRSSRYDLVIKVHAADEVEASGLLQRLLAVAHNTLDGIEYTSYCLFDQCHLEDESAEFSDPPNFWATIRGAFAYTIDASTGLKTTR